MSFLFEFIGLSYKEMQNLKVITL